MKPRTIIAAFKTAAHKTIVVAIKMAKAEEAYITIPTVIGIIGGITRQIS
jgi:hypothetical protein